jgi:hypothetical protein
MSIQIAPNTPFQYSLERYAQFVEPGYNPTKLSTRVRAKLSAAAGGLHSEADRVNLKNMRFSAEAMSNGSSDSDDTCPRSHHGSSWRPFRSGKREASPMAVITLDLFIVGLIGFASVIALIAFKAFLRSGNGSQPLLLVTVVALFGVAGLLVAKEVTPLAGSPAAPAPAPPSPAAEHKEPQFVYDLPRRDQLKYDSQTEVSIDDALRPTRGMQLCVNSRQTWEYAIDGKYATFQASLKLDGPSSTGAVVNFAVVTDDKPIKMKIKGGEVARIEIPLKDIKQLKLMANFIHEPMGSCNSLFAQWVDAKVMPN